MASALRDPLLTHIPRCKSPVFVVSGFYCVLTASTPLLYLRRYKEHSYSLEVATQSI